MNCPICDTEMKYTKYMDGYTIVEYEDTCPNECYHEHFAYGSTEIIIGRTVTLYDCSDESKERREIIRKQIKALIEIEKEYIK